jgi:hypothetical protein
LDGARNAVPPDGYRDEKGGAEDWFTKNKLWEVTSFPIKNLKGSNLLFFSFALGIRLSHLGRCWCSGNLQLKWTHIVA